MKRETATTAFYFWQGWLYYTSILFACAGIAFAFSGDSIIFQPYTKLLARVFWHTDEMPQEADDLRAFVYGCFGGTLACCYILLAFIAKYAFKQKELWARNVIIMAFSIWVIIDSMTCLRFGVYPQIYVINTFSILVKALPIIFTWKEFRPSQ